MRIDDLAHVPVPLFAAAMGWGGLTMVWRKAHEALGWPVWAGETAAAVTAVIFVAVSLLYGYKALRHWPETVHEFRHPVRVNFFAAISIDLMILAGIALPYSRGGAEILWLAGAALHLSLALYVIGRWIEHPQDPATFNPAWYIPVVGNVLAPITGVKLGCIDAAWFFFAVGVTFWLGMLPMMLNRAIFGGALPPKMLPTLAILAAPPAVGFLAWRALDSVTAGPGAPLDALAHVLIYAALFTGLLVIRLITVLIRLPFAPSWWAYTFPFAALAAGLMELAAVKGGVFFTALAGAFAVGVTGIVLLVTARTMAEILAGRLFQPE